MLQFYHPHLSELMTRITSMITNIILGFIYSWEVSLELLF